MSDKGFEQYTIESLRERRSLLVSCDARVALSRCGRYEAVILQVDGFGEGRRYGIRNTQTKRWLSRNYASEPGVVSALGKL